MPNYSNSPTPLNKHLDKTDALLEIISLVVSSALGISIAAPIGALIGILTGSNISHGFIKGSNIGAALGLAVGSTVTNRGVHIALTSTLEGVIGEKLIKYCSPGPKIAASGSMFCSKQYIQIGLMAHLLKFIIGKGIDYIADNNISSLKVKQLFKNASHTLIYLAALNWVARTLGKETPVALMVLPLIRCLIDTLNTLSVNSHTEALSPRL